MYKIYKYFLVLLITTLIGLVLFYNYKGLEFDFTIKIFYIIFFIEFIIKNIICKEYKFTFKWWIDLIFIIPLFYFKEKVVLIFSIFSILKLMQFSPAFILLKDVIINEKKSLLAALYLMIMVVLGFSLIMYFAEKDVNEKFSTLFNSIYWSIITLSTVGYGDVTPMTNLGKLITSIGAMIGLGLFALPAGIIARGLGDAIENLKYETTIEMLKKVPLFSNLEYTDLAALKELLKLRIAQKNEIIIKKGDIGSSMYFILKGNVSVFKDNKQIILKEGDFFGEIALIKSIPRTATVIANTKTELLELSRIDFENFIHQRQYLYEIIKEKAEERL